MPKLYGETQLEQGLELVYVGGNSERMRAMQLGLEALESTGFFSDITPLTINQADSRKGQRLLRAAGAPGESKKIFGGHSMGLSRVPRGWQALAFNPAEPISFKEQLEGGGRILKNDIDPEEGAHKTGFLDMLGAVWQQASSPITTYRTMSMLNNGYSSVDHLANRDNFPGGAIFIHGEGDNFENGFGFVELASTPENQEKIRKAGGKLIVLADIDHITWLFEPRRVITAAGTDVFPQEAIYRMNQAA